MSPTFPTEFSPLPPFRNSRFALEVMRPEFNEIDLEAVMSSRESLRVWSDSSWPEDDFSLERNLEDLKVHIDDHAERRAYAYSVFNPEKNRCLGSSYVKPIAVMEAYWLPDERLCAEMTKFVTRIDFWLRDSEVAAGGDEALVRTIQNWIAEHWSGGVAFALRPGMEQRSQAYRSAGLRELGKAKSRETSQTVSLFGL